MAHRRTPMLRMTLSIEDSPKTASPQHASPVHSGENDASEANVQRPSSAGPAASFKASRMVSKMAPMLRRVVSGKEAKHSPPPVVGFKEDKPAAGSRSIVPPMFRRVVSSSSSRPVQTTASEAESSAVTCSSESEVDAAPVRNNSDLSSVSSKMPQMFRRVVNSKDSPKKSPLKSSNDTSFLSGKSMMPPMLRRVVSSSGSGAGEKKPEKVKKARSATEDNIPVDPPKSKTKKKVRSATEDHAYLSSKAGSSNSVVSMMPPLLRRVVTGKDSKESKKSPPSAAHIDTEAQSDENEPEIENIRNSFLSMMRVPSQRRNSQVPLIAASDNDW